MSNEVLYDSARLASLEAHAPYSGFAVGAAILTSEGSIVTGNNYETSNFRSICAERQALANLRPGQIPVAIAIYSPRSATHLTPCGDCRQALWERNPDLRVHCLGSGEVPPRELTIRELLPHVFGLHREAVSHNRYIVHFPLLPARLTWLKGIQAAILVGSPIRAKNLALSLDPGAQSYCHLPYGDTDREYSLFALPQRQLVVASHGIGAAGAEIVMSELPALFAEAGTTLRKVIRSGTRGSLRADVPLGALAITDKALHHAPGAEEAVEPDPQLLASLAAAAPSQESIYRGVGLTCDFFWRDQARSPYLRSDFTREFRHAETLENWRQQGISWLEMEDFHILRLAEEVGIAAATIGLVVSDRTQGCGYSAEAKHERELLPGLVAAEALSSRTWE